ncbi:MAG: hypothetical protein AOA65_1780 [Candidatus Bathyarchaeota archaeon BA1]|nr:MAG: hypothetical protein AOA65_1780 [Candidatus Bathyarchaeota archaeon BA1]
MMATLLIAIPIGVLLGLLSGYTDGFVDQAVSGVIDTLSFPTILLALAIVVALVQD